ncbi:hypothetical protein HK096_004075, partial [Nowakowskiella sp. JEL0078]
MFRTLTLLLLMSTVVFGTPSVYLCGDSTMQTWPTTSVIDGWGHYFSTFITLPVVNKAIAGRSARSFTREGRFQVVADLLVSGDIVVIEFGHNDGGYVKAGVADTSGRSPAAGTANETVTVDYNGVSEVVHTYTWYIEQAAKLMKSKGAKVIISGNTPDNIWDSTNKTISPANRFETYSKTAAALASSYFVSHFNAVAAAYEALGRTAVDALFPQDHTHTSPAGALVVARAYTKAALCANSVFTNYLTTAGISAGGSCVKTTSTTTSQKPTSSTTLKTTTAIPTTKASSSAKTSTTASVCVPLYGQCGGLTYTGSTTCCSGSN